MTEHLLTVEVDAETAERFPDDDPEYRWSITCINPNDCHGWIECDKPHEVDGVNAGDGPYDSEEGAPWDGYDEFDFHGQTHTWHDGWGWDVPHPGCVVQGMEVEFPDELDPITRSGRWIVDDAWDGEFCTLTLVREAEEESR